MKKLVLLIALAVVSISAFSQSRNYLKFDTTYIMKDGGNGELVLVNATKDSTGFLFNKGNGRTEFRRAVIGNYNYTTFGN